MGRRLTFGAVVCAVLAAAGCSSSKPPTASSGQEPGSGQSAKPVTASALHCPADAQLEAAWQKASAAVRRSWADGTAAISGFNSVSCWNSYDVAQPSGNASGLFVFSRHGGEHLLAPTELRQFSQMVCSSKQVPAGFENVAAGPANCQP